MAFAYSLSVELITYVKVKAMTGDASYAESSDNHGLVIVLKNGSKYEAELPNYKARDRPYEIELSAKSDFQPSLVCSKQYIKEVYLVARGNDGWYITSIETYARKNEQYTKLTADPDFNKWVDGDEEDQYPYDAKKHLLTKNGKKKWNKHQSNGDMIFWHWEMVGITIWENYEI